MDEKGSDRLVLNTREACELLQISKPTLYSLLNRQSDPCPCWRVGRKILIPARLLQDWLERQAEEAVS